MPQGNDTLSVEMILVEGFLYSVQEHAMTHANELVDLCYDIEANIPEELPRKEYEKLDCLIKDLTYASCHEPVVEYFTIYEKLRKHVDKLKELKQKQLRKEARKKGGD